MFERNRIADTLRNAREKRGMTVEEAAAAAGIPLQYLRLLEGESGVRVGVSDELYLIPFFRKYASFMSIDAEELLPDFLGMLQQIPGETNPPVRLDYRPRYAGWWKPMVVLVSIGLGVMLSRRQAGNRMSFEEATDGKTTAPPMSAETASTPGPPMPPTTQAAAAPMPPPATPVPSDSPAPQLAAALVGVHALTIAAKDESWLALAVDDQPAKQYLLRGGESRTWSAARFSLTVGNAGGVSLALDGRELPPIGKPGQVIRSLRFPGVTPSPTPG